MEEEAAGRHRTPADWRTPEVSLLDGSPVVPRPRPDRPLWRVAVPLSARPATAYRGRSRLRWLVPISAGSVLIGALIGGARYAPPWWGDRVVAQISAHLPGVAEPAPAPAVKIKKVKLHRGSKPVLRTAHGVTVAASSDALWVTTDPATGYTAQVLVRDADQWQPLMASYSPQAAADTAVYPTVAKGRYRIELVDRTGTTRQRWSFTNTSGKVTAHDAPGQFAFYYATGSTPSRWCDGEEHLTDPGHRIGYQIDFFGTDQVGLPRKQVRTFVGKAFRQWSQASGGKYRFTYEGAATLPPNQYGEADWEAIPEGTIGVSFVGGATSGWGDYSSTHLATIGDSAVVGLGSSMTSSVPGDGIRSGVIVQGGVLIDAQQIADPARAPLGYWDQQAQITELANVTLHEIGHALGLQHVGSGIMAPTTGSGVATIDEGARAGIRRLAELPCLSVGS